ncbi:unnamed protein product (macronuclear) [Paramecium tetraurelia]|uniref:Uncharacterized protein n=1 Tax=Paramecium tetraurelia TaxID=5888 RepID=A0CNH9_PARTE|nr:uncharacterized protein GSPATT00008788001 [Paramecium tetraurelia]CAK72346.1 unnamed protein product [Paramecium tetraurelia]|eukprot:XP_001439743.1 hypothetical protein (macronuclear) [Paramecium tetraurelia strain d4-2]
MIDQHIPKDNRRGEEIVQKSVGEDGKQKQDIQHKIYTKQAVEIGELDKNNPRYTKSQQVNTDSVDIDEKFGKKGMQSQKD